MRIILFINYLLGSDIDLLQNQSGLMMQGVWSGVMGHNKKAVKTKFQPLSKYNIIYYSSLKEIGWLK